MKPSLSGRGVWQSESQSSLGRDQPRPSTGSLATLASGATGLVGVVCLAIAAMLAVSGCEKSVTPHLRIAFPNWLGYGIFHLALERDFFRQEGAEVHLVHQHSVADSRRALERGQVDAICCTLVEAVFSAQEMTEPPCILSVIDSSVGGDMLLGNAQVLKEGLKPGTRVGLEIAGNDAFLLHLALQKLGIARQQLKLVPAYHDDMIAAVRANRVDAVVTYPPESFELLKTPGWGVIFDSSQSPGEILDLLLVSGKSLANDHQAWVKVLKALEKARRWRLENPDEAIDILARVYGISREEVIAAEKGILFYDSSAQKDFVEGKSSLKQKMEKTSAALTEMGLPLKDTKKLPQIRLDFDSTGGKTP